MAILVTSTVRAMSDYRATVPAPPAPDTDTPPAKEPQGDPHKGPEKEPWSDPGDRPRTVNLPPEQTPPNIIVPPPTNPRVSSFELKLDAQSVR